MKLSKSFKPCYKWNTFNTTAYSFVSPPQLSVLNLVINGIPSIRFSQKYISCYLSVLNLVINGIPSIPETNFTKFSFTFVLNLVINGIPSILKSGYFYDNTNAVLNLVINGIPSIPSQSSKQLSQILCFKPCYKWNTFNTSMLKNVSLSVKCFKPCYKWNTFNTLDLNKNIDFMAF